jgi:hypothetical protein
MVALLSITVLSASALQVVPSAGGAQAALSTASAGVDAAARSTGRKTRTIDRSSLPSAGSSVTRASAIESLTVPVTSIAPPIANRCGSRSSTKSAR